MNASPSQEGAVPPRSTRATRSAGATRPRRVARDRALVVAAAAAAAVAVWTLAVPILGLELSVPDSPGSPNRSELELQAVVPAALLASAAGWVLLAVLERVTTAALTIWTAVAVAVLLLSMPYLPGFTAVERAVLAAQHAALAAVLIPGLRRTARPRRG